MASFSLRSNRRIMACTPWLAPSVKYRKSGSQGYPSLSSIPCDNAAGLKAASWTYFGRQRAVPLCAVSRSLTLPQHNFGAFY